jgi:hypothetical protein
MDEIDPNGDFRVMKMDGQFHVVFRPFADPQWFRIIASFYTYERAYQYCDVERVLFYDGDSGTSDEEKVGSHAPPIELDTDKHIVEADIAGLVRDLWPENAEATVPLPVEDFTDQPDTTLVVDTPILEKPEDYHKRLAAEAYAKAADSPTCTECGAPRSPGSASMCRACYVGKTQKPLIRDPDISLTQNQSAVFNFFACHANPQQLVNASIKEIAEGAGVAKGSMGMLLEALERKGLIEVVERGSPTRSGVFRVNALEVTA